MRSWWRRIDWARWGRLLRRYWWVYPAWLVLKWGTILLLGRWAWKELPTFLD